MDLRRKLSVRLSNQRRVSEVRLGLAWVICSRNRLGRGKWMRVKSVSEVRDVSVAIVWKSWSWLVSRAGCKVIVVMRLAIS